MRFRLSCLGFLYVLSFFLLRLIVAAAECPQDHFCDGSSPAQQKCPDHSTTVRNGVHKAAKGISDCECLAGFYRDQQTCKGLPFCLCGCGFVACRINVSCVVGVFCAACPAGTYKDDISNADKCTGTSARDRRGLIICADCAAGKYADTAGMIYCKGQAPRCYLAQLSAQTAALATTAYKAAPGNSVVLNTPTRCLEPAPRPL